MNITYKPKGATMKKSEALARIVELQEENILLKDEVSALSQECQAKQELIDELLDKLADYEKLQKENEDLKVLDKDVAEALGITPEHLCMLKLHKRVPLEVIARFCAKRHICINWMLFDQHPRSLCENTEKFIYAIPA